VVTAGTTSERLLRKLNEEKKLDLKITSAKDHGESFLILESGRAAAFMLDDVLLSGEVAKARKPADWVVTRHAPVARGVRLLDAQGRQAVQGGSRSHHLRAGDVGRDRADLREVVPEAHSAQGLNLNFPLSDEMKALFKGPNDKAID